VVGRVGLLVVGFIVGSLVVGELEGFGSVGEGVGTGSAHLQSPVEVHQLGSTRQFCSHQSSDTRLSVAI